MDAVLFQFGHGMFIFALFTLASASLQWHLSKKDYANSTFDKICTSSNDFKLNLMKQFNCSIISNVNDELFSLVNNRIDNCLRVCANFARF